MQRELTVQTRMELLQEAIEHMETEYASAIAIDDVAATIATSRRQLQRCFGEHAGESFRDCLARIRMRRAAELLARTRLPVRDVAEQVGYRQPAQFAKAFRRVHGVPPSAYRASGGAVRMAA